MELQPDSLPRSKDPTIGLHPEPGEHSSYNSYVLFSEVSF